MAGTTHAVIVGGGFAGVACAKRLAGEPRARVTLLDRTGYHQFQPLLYQVATAELAPRRHPVRPGGDVRPARQRRGADG